MKSGSLNSAIPGATPTTWQGIEEYYHHSSLQVKIRNTARRFN